jgi:hypothetical protein
MPYRHEDKLVDRGQCTRPRCGRWAPDTCVGPRLLPISCDEYAPRLQQAVNYTGGSYCVCHKGLPPGRAAKCTALPLWGRPTHSWEQSRSREASPNISPLTQSSRYSPLRSILAFRIRGFHGSGYEECRLLGCEAAWLF